VRRWFVYSVLTGRYSSSPESMFDLDVRNISSKDFKSHLKMVEDGDLSDAFWDVNLVQHLDSSVSSSPYFNVYLASQIKANDTGFLSRDITVGELVTHAGDIHHVFPKDYLKKNGLKRGMYNQIANYVYMQSEINIKVGNKAPNVYFGELKEQCNNGGLKYGGIDSEAMLLDNLKLNCIPDVIFDMDIKDYEGFLKQRRKLMAQKIKEYYHSL
jgi:hypothetical protein